MPCDIPDAALPDEWVPVNDQIEAVIATVRERIATELAPIFAAFKEKTGITVDANVHLNVNVTLDRPLFKRAT